MCPHRGMMWDLGPGCQQWCPRAHIPLDSPMWGHWDSQHGTPKQMLAQLGVLSKKVSQAPCMGHRPDCWLQSPVCKKFIFDFSKQPCSLLLFQVIASRSFSTFWDCLWVTLPLEKLLFLSWHRFMGNAVSSGLQLSGFFWQVEGGIFQCGRGE